MEFTIKPLAEREKNLLKTELVGIKPCIAMVLASQDIASKKYIENKAKLLDELKIEHKEYFLVNPNQEELNNLLDKLSSDDMVTGIMLELPLEKGLDSYEAIEHISYKKDVDGLTNYHLGRLLKNQETILPCTVLAVLKILNESKIDLEGKNIAIIGRSILLGKPLHIVLTNKNATCVLCHSKTKNLKEITTKADIVIVAIGKKGYITKEFLKDNAFVIDVETNYFQNKVYGDVDFENASNENNLITPVPYGVGLMTKISMIENLITLTKKYNKN